MARPYAQRLTALGSDPLRHFLTGMVLTLSPYMFGRVGEESFAATLEMRSIAIPVTVPLSVHEGHGFAFHSRQARADAYAAHTPVKTDGPRSRRASLSQAD